VPCSVRASTFHQPSYLSCYFFVSPSLNSFIK
jgi:hypothetical protein